MDDQDPRIQRAVQLKQGRAFAQAEALLREVLTERPGTPLAEVLLGQVLVESGRAADAVAYLSPIAEAQPHRPFVRFALGIALNRLGRVAEAAEHFAGAAMLRPGDPEMTLWHGATLQRLGRIDEATGVFRQMMGAFAENPQHLLMLAERLERIGRLDLAVECYERAFAGGIEDAQALLRGGQAALGARDVERALEWTRRAAALAPGVGAVHLALADLYDRLNRLEEATASAREALRLDPGSTAAIRLVARLARRSGRGEEGEAMLRRALEHPPTDPRLLAPMLIEHAHALDALGRYDEAFEAVSRGKALWYEVVRERYPLEAIEAELAARARAVEAVQERATDGERAGRAPVFFVGFPRSGTTLMEQVLAAHPDVVTLDETDLLERQVVARARAMIGETDARDDAIVRSLSPEQLAELRGAYLREAARALGEDRGDRLLVDKLPMNITRLGLIRALFPDARVLVALRDPRDCCISGLFQFFDANETMVHFSSLERTASLYARVMRMWFETRDRVGLAWHAYRYEDLTADFEGTLREVLAFLGLAWSDEVRRFQDRARERAISTPSYERVTGEIDRRAVARWRNYARHIEPVRETLGEMIEALGYEA